MSTEQGRGAPPPSEPRVIHVEGVQAAQVGDYNVQYVYNHNYGPRIWTDSPGQLPADDAGSTDGSPYRGLRAFELKDAPFFFGRDQAVDELMSALDEHARGTGLVVVSGASGAGKSSLLRAGVLPRIRRDGLASMPGSSGWPCLLLTPGNAPLDELAVQVATLAGTDAGQAVRGLAADPSRFAYSARQAALAQYQGPGSARLVLVIDQFEHLFTQCQDSAQRRGYVAALRAAATGGGSEPAALVVLGVRAEFEARCAEFPELSDAINHHRLLTAMTERQLRLAIIGPAGKAGADVEEALVDALLAEIRARSAGSTGVATAAGALPLLSYALDQTWRGRSGNILTLADYERTGGIETAVAESAQHAYDGLSPARRGTARQIFLQLTAVSDDGATDTAVPASRAELMAGKDPADVRAVLDDFAEQRLLTLDADTVQISHEVLLTAWPLFRDDWLAQTRDDRVIRTRLRVAAGEWVNSRRDRSYLYSGIVLASATAVAERAIAEAGRPWPLTDEEREFLQSSVRASQRRTQLLLGAVAVLTALVVALGVVTIVAFTARAQTGRARDVAVAGELAAESEALGDANPVLARLEALAAWRIHPSDQARYAMLRAAALPGVAVLTGTPGQVQSTAFSPDGRILAIGTSTSTAGVAAVQLWDNASHRPIGHPLRIAGAGTVDSVTFSPNGRVLAAGTEYGGTQLWEVTSHALLGVLSADDNQVEAAAFSPNGETLAVASGKGSLTAVAGVQLWNVASRAPAGRSLVVNGGAAAVAFSPDGQTIAVAPFGGGPELWQFATGRPPTAVPIYYINHITALAFTHNGAILMAGGPNGAEWWNTITQHPIGGLTTDNTFSRIAQPAAFSPDGKMLAILGGQQNVQLRTAGTGKSTMLAFSSPVGAGAPLAFSPDGGTLSFGLGAGLELINVAAATEAPTAIVPARPSLLSGALSPDGTTLSLGGPNGSLELRSAVTGKPVGVPLTAPGLSDDLMAVGPRGAIMAVLTDAGIFLRRASARQLTGVPLPGTNAASAISFSPDGTMLAVASRRSNTVQLWDWPRRTLVATIPDASSTPLTFSDSGQVLAADSGGVLGLYAAATGKLIGTLSGADDVYSVAFSPNGKLLAVSSLTGVQLWTLGATPQPDETIATGVGPSIAFSPDGTALAVGTQAGSQSDTVFYYLGTRQQIGLSLPSAGVAWTAGGTTLVGAGGLRGPTDLWNVGYLLAANTAPSLCALAGQTLSSRQWAHYAPGVPYVNVCR